MADDLAAAIARSKAVADVTIGRGVLGEAGAMVRRHFGARAIVVVADENTLAAAGAPLIAGLGDLSVRHITLPAQPRPKASVELGEELARAFGDALPIALGSGVVNDVTKYAAFLLDRRYMSVPTAASMDGYASAGAPLSKGGFKQTIATRAPLAILADLDVVAAAPAAMSAWGYGDTAGKVPASADWMVADALRIEPIDDVAWPIVQRHLATWLGAPGAVRAGDRDAIDGLFSGLILSGLAMEFYGSSRPASGADHQIAHMWEMENLMQDGERVSHGACVAVGTVAALRLFDWLIAQDLTALDTEAVVAGAPSLDDKRREIDALMAPALAERALPQTERKHLSPAAHRARIAAIKDAWPVLQDRLRRDVLRADAVREMLRAAGAPVVPSDIGVDRERFRRTVLAARFIRDRYTVLDLLEECGLLGRAMNALDPLQTAA